MLSPNHVTLDLGLPLGCGCKSGFGMGDSNHTSVFWHLKSLLEVSLLVTSQIFIV